LIFAEHISTATSQWSFYAVLTLMNSSVSLSL